MVRDEAVVSPMFRSFESLDLEALQPPRKLVAKKVWMKLRPVDIRKFQKTGAFHIWRFVILNFSRLKVICDSQIVLMGR